MARISNSAKGRFHNFSPREFGGKKMTSEFFALNTADSSERGIIYCNDQNHAFAAAASANKKQGVRSWVACRQTRDGFYMLDFVSRAQRAS